MLRSYIDAFVHLWYPHICLACGTDILEKKNVLCAHCIGALPYVEFDNTEDNPIQKIFWGRVQFSFANSLLFFTKDSVVQLLVTELKYKQNKKAGWMLGRLMGMYINEVIKEDPIDFLIPIPITNTKLKKRGYNQSTILCQGIQSITGMPILEDLLLKPFDTQSQTHKDRVNRMDAIGQSFVVKQTSTLKNKHVLLIDDVLTTGATIEAAANILQQSALKKISVFTATYTI
jgi:ComF family protein